MKKILLFFAFVAMFVSACKKEVSTSESLSFQNLRELQVTENKLRLVDDTSYQTTSLLLENKLLFLYTWRQGIYAGPIIPTRVFWASHDEYEFAFIAQDDLFYTRLLVLYPNKEIKTFDVSVIKLLSADLITNGDSLYLKLVYNNSWTRTGPRPDVEKKISL